MAVIGSPDLWTTRITAAAPQRLAPRRGAPQRPPAAARGRRCGLAPGALEVLDGGGDQREIGEAVAARRRQLARRQLAVEHADVHLPGQEVGVAQQRAVERRGGTDALDP